MKKYEVLFDEHKDEPIARIRLTSDKWNGIVYHYNTIKFLEESGDEATLKFEYDIVETPNTLDIDNLVPEDKKEFETLLGDILVEIITEAASETGTNDTSKSDL